MQVANPCLICHDALGSDVAMPDVCHHAFCWRCLLEWSRRQSTCPLCRRKFAAIHIRPEQAKNCLMVFLFHVYMLPENLEGFKNMIQGELDVLKLGCSCGNCCLCGECPSCTKTENTS